MPGGIRFLPHPRGLRFTGAPSLRGEARPGVICLPALRAGGTCVFSSAATSVVTATDIASDGLDDRINRSLVKDLHSDVQGRRSTRSVPCAQEKAVRTVATANGSAERTLALRRCILLLGNEVPANKHAATDCDHPRGVLAPPHGSDGIDRQIKAPRLVPPARDGNIEGDCR